MPNAEEAQVSRVLMTADGVGGVWPYALDLCRALARHGISVDLAVMGPALNDAQRAAAARITNVSLHESVYRLEWMSDPWDDVDRATRWLLDLEATVEPDVVHLNGYSHAAAPFRAPVLVVAHSCVLSWWQAVLGSEAPDSWHTYAARVRDGVHAARTVVAPTRAMAESVAAIYGRPRDLRVIANGRCPDSFVPATEKEPFVLTSGRVWDEGKNVQTVCAAASRLSWPVVVAGDAAAPDGSRRTPAGVRYMGRLDEGDLCHLYSRAAIFALPARYEPFGLSPLEAALSGCALVLGDIRSLREVWGEAAVFVPPDNRCALASAVESLIADEALRAKIASRARERATQFTADRMAAGYADLYRELSGARAAARGLA